MQIVISGWSVYVESLNLTLRQGIACVWDEGERLFMPDFDVTVVYEGNIETQDWLYYEQDGMVVTLGRDCDSGWKKIAEVQRDGTNVFGNPAKGDREAN